MTAEVSQIEGSGSNETVGDSFTIIIPAIESEHQFDDVK
jgi:hypothetical protein